MISVVFVLLGLLTSSGLSQRGGGLSCPEKTGRFPTGQCDSYIECIEGIGEEKLCPDGLLFNPKAYFTFPCQYPVDVSCEGRSSTQPPQATDECPHQFGYFKLGDANDCGRFLNCVNGRGFVFNCPAGLAFSEDTYRCDWPDQVASCNAEAYLGFTCPESNGAFGDEFRFYRSPSDCQKYFICVNGRPRLYGCDENSAFNDDIGGCDALENVTSCYNEVLARRNEQNIGEQFNQQPIQQQSRPQFRPQPNSFRPRF